MPQQRITHAELLMWSLTRGLIGFGAGLLVYPRIVRRRRRVLGRSMLGIGLLSTIPLAIRLLRHREGSERARRREYQKAGYEQTAGEREPTETGFESGGTEVYEVLIAD